MSIITRINKAEKRIVDLYNKLKNLPSGDFIPLTGTEEGSPVTGDIEMQEYTKLWWKNGDYLLSLENVDEYLYLQIYNPITLYFSKFIIDGDTNNFRIETNNPNSVGLVSVEDFSEVEPKNKLIYAQRSYVDKANSYSTEETLTGGTWIDGKPIYRKVFEGIVPAGGYIDNIEPDNIETLVNYGGNVYESGFEIQYGIKNQNVILDSGIVSIDGLIEGLNYKVIVEYTKTTD